MMKKLLILLLLMPSLSLGEKNQSEQCKRDVDFTLNWEIFPSNKLSINITNLTHETLSIRYASIMDVSGELLAFRNINREIRNFSLSYETTAFENIGNIYIICKVLLENPDSSNSSDLIDRTFGNPDTSNVLADLASFKIVENLNERDLFIFLLILILFIFLILLIFKMTSNSESRILLKKQRKQNEIEFKKTREILLKKQKEKEEIELKKLKETELKIIKDERIQKENLEKIELKRIEVERIQKEKAEEAELKRIEVERIQREKKAIELKKQKEKEEFELKQELDLVKAVYAEKEIEEQKKIKEKLKLQQEQIEQEKQQKIEQLRKLNFEDVKEKKEKLEKKIGISDKVSNIDIKKKLYNISSSPNKPYLKNLKKFSQLYENYILINFSDSSVTEKKLSHNWKLLFDAFQTLTLMTEHFDSNTPTTYITSLVVEEGYISDERFIEVQLNLKLWQKLSIENEGDTNVRKVLRVFTGFNEDEL